MDEMPSWWPPKWTMDTDGSKDHHWYPFGQGNIAEEPGNAGTAEPNHPMVRMWGGGEIQRNGRTRYHIYNRPFQSVAKCEDLLEVLCVLIELEKNL